MSEDNQCIKGKINISNILNFICPPTFPEKIVVNGIDFIHMGNGSYEKTKEGKK